MEGPFETSDDGTGVIPESVAQFWMKSYRSSRLYIDISDSSWSDLWTLRDLYTWDGSDFLNSSTPRYRGRIQVADLWLCQGFQFCSKNTKYCIILSHKQEYTQHDVICRSEILVRLDHTRRTHLWSKGFLSSWVVTTWICFTLAKPCSPLGWVLPISDINEFVSNALQEHDYF